jgi:hypothetical protein
MIRSRHENRKPFAPNFLKIQTHQHRCNKVPCLAGNDAFAFVGAPSRAGAIAELPTSNKLTAGRMAQFNSALLPTYNASLAEGGYVTIPLFCNAVAWIAHQGQGAQAAAGLRFRQ